MTGRRVLWGLVAGLSILAVAGIGLLSWVLLHPRAISPNTLLISDSSSLVHLQVANGTTEVLADDVQPAQFRFPAISPSGGKVAFVATDGEQLGLFSLNLHTGERHKVYSSLVAEPFDIAWSPDEQYLLFLAPGPGALFLLMVPEDGSAEPTPIASGQTIYFAWNQDGSQLALHIDGHTLQRGRVELYTPGQAATTPFASDPGFFDAPAFAQDGTSLFYVSQPQAGEGSNFAFEQVHSEIVQVGLDGSNPQVLASEPLAWLRMSRSPANDTLAYNVQRLAEDGTFAWGELKLIEPGSQQPRVLSKPEEQVDSFFWSPDGQQIAYLSSRGTYTLLSERTLNIVDVASGTTRQVATFTPSDSFSELAFFFDAYLHSYTPWAPDSAFLAYAAQDGIYLVDTQAGTSKRTADGTFVLWAKTLE